MDIFIYILAFILFVLCTGFVFASIRIIREGLAQKIQVSDNGKMGFDEESDSIKGHKDISNNEAMDVCTFDITRREDYKFNVHFVKQYFEKLHENLAKVRKSIVVLDYLSHNKHNKIKIHKYGEEIFLESEYEKYFDYLEDICAKNPEIQYTRILQLPLDIHVKSGDRFNNDYDFLLKRTLELIFPQTLKHLKNLESYPNFKLFIINPPIRLASHMILDNEILLSEYDRYDEFGEANPDTLFIDRVISEKDKVARTISTYNDQINHVIRDKENIHLEDLFKKGKYSIEKKKISSTLKTKTRAKKSLHK